MRDLPPGSTSARPRATRTSSGPDDMIIKIEELREATDWQVPIFVKLGACRVYDDVKLAAKAGADVVVIDGMEGASAASPEMLQDHTGIPTLAAVCEAREALEEIGLYGEVQLVIAGRHPQRRRRRQGAGPGRGRRLHRHRRADRAQLQQAALRRGLRDARRRAVPATTATPAAARSGSRRRIRS